MRRHIKSACVLCVVVFCIALLSTRYFYEHFNSHIVLEAGEKPEIVAVWDGIGNAAFTADAASINATLPGEYPVTVVLWGWFRQAVTVTVKDTVPPRVETRRLSLRYGERCGCSDFIISCEDATAVSFSYLEEPDFSMIGIQNIKIVAVDLGENQQILETILFIPNVKNEVLLEIGTKIPEVEEFLLQKGSRAAYLSDLSRIDPMRIGKHLVTVEVDGEKYESILQYADLTPPKAVLKEKEGWLHKEIAPEEFVESVEDMSQVTILYEKEPDWDREGRQDIELILTDEGNNSIHLKTVVDLKEDKVSPVIIGNSITVVVGKNVSYKKAISVVDNCDMTEEISLKIDTSAVNLKEIGEYPVFCMAQDTSGNMSEKEIIVHVVQENVISYDLETINQLADKVLGKIITDGMNQYEKAEKIYKWIRGHVGYISHSEKGNWMRGAYEGLEKHKGDCYVFACTAKALLTRAGIPNLDIVKATTNPSHYWNLVDVGTGWLHFDTTPRKDKAVFFLLTDEQMKAYSDAHKGTHNFDRSLYPPIS